MKKNKKVLDGSSKSYKKMTAQDAGRLGGQSLVKLHGIEHLKRLGKKYGFKKGHKLGMTGKHHSKETIEKIKKSLTGMKYPTNSGINHPAWKGGITAEGYPVEFNKKLKEKIRERDGNICQLCGITKEESLEYYGINLCINHIDFNKLNCKENNLNTLCNFCNSWVNWDRKFFTTLFKAKLIGKEKEISKNIFEVASFKHFCRRNKCLRFWQALFAWVEQDIEVGGEDPFYWEGKNE